jgi:hypothetical protein
MIPVATDGYIPTADEAPTAGMPLADPAGAEAPGAEASGADDSPAIGALDGEITRPRADLEELIGEPGTSTAEEATSAGAGTPDAEAVR